MSKNNVTTTDQGFQDYECPNEPGRPDVTAFRQASDLDEIVELLAGLGMPDPLTRGNRLECRQPRLDPFHEDSRPTGAKPRHCCCQPMFTT